MDAPQSSPAPTAVAPPPEPAKALPPAPTHHRGRWPWIVGVLMVLAAAGVWLWPTVALSMSTVSTDDAYINGHVTTVAPRVYGQVVRVLVDDNVRVKKGDLLVELDKEPYRVQVTIKKATVTAAEADLTAARASARAVEASARGARWKTQNAVEQVHNQIASLRAAVATYKSRVATRERAQADYDRGKKLGTSLSQEELDTRQQNVRVADAAADEAMEQVARIRVGLGQTPKPAEGTDLAAVPADLPQTFSAVRQALGELAQSLARLGLPLLGTNDTPDEAIAKFKKLDANGDIDKILEKLVPDAPEVKQAEAKLLQAKSDLAQAELNLRYCDIFAEIDGVVTRRNINPGNTAQVGQAIMAVRSLTEVWVDANFKETQLADLSIGQRVQVFTDVYGGKKAFNGRITGFTYGTGSTLALLPPQNATGNFVKVVQRLPVRIEFEDYDADKDVLFAGLSVVPYVYVKEAPAGPNAGRKLQQLARESTPAGGGK
ncbi:HlyD family secretion protein [Limnoglobus roseus]|uniref:Multidrug transporter n=1 Tax=Limnoglobus roseus TaxID=2598579 RepID=A0A5C1A792_9BACT|nr:HlyD family secretion protein [Limnoglobus roseus]QEL14067.1 multidrug transporter [Limnoglobus roseus]